jgi:hypothetical protein
MMNPNLKSDGITRRDAIKVGLAGAASLALGDPTQLLAATTRAALPATPVAPARSVIQIWMWGGPSHVDTFDPKPDAGRDYTGPLDKPIPTNVDGIQVGQLLPNLAKQADKFSIIRSMTHGVNAHETASYLMQTGRLPGRISSPSVGAVVSQFKGYDAGYEGPIAPYVVLTQTQGRFSECGCLGQNYKPLATGGDPNGQRFVVEGIVAEGISDQRQHDRRQLMHDLDTLGKAMAGDAKFGEHDKAEQAAYETMFGKAREVFDLGREDEALRDRYGRNHFGQCCLVARRLVEVGVPYVTINYRGWDTHKQHFQTMQRKMPEMDAAMATLLADLDQRGLLDRTILWWGGEFGRSPKVQWQPPWNGGRGHFGRCFSVVVAGGGFAGGKVVGASNAKGDEVAERPVYPIDLLGSIYTLLGIDPKAKLANPRNLDLTVLPEPGGEVKSAGLLKEIML